MIGRERRGKGRGGWERGGTFAGTQRVLSEVKCDEIEDGKGSETSMKNLL